MFRVPQGLEKDSGCGLAHLLAEMVSSDALIPGVLPVIKRDNPAAPP
jgi:hypothetical protein